jgi:hypothetical protein
VSAWSFQLREWFWHSSLEGVNSLGSRSTYKLTTATTWRYSCFVFGGTSIHHQPLTLKMEATYTSETFAESPTTTQPPKNTISIISYTFQYL